MENIDNKQSEARQRNLLRFVHAQDNGGIYEGTATYAEALQEVKNGHKRSHWIWYVFPQMKGLGKSEISQYYGINGREEAKAYIEHPAFFYSFQAQSPEIYLYKQENITL